MKRPLRIHRAPAAEADLESHVQFLIDAGEPAVARRFLAEFEAALQILRRHPNLGSATTFRSGRLRNVRRWILPGFPNHLVYYGSTREEIQIVRVLHGARDLPALFGGGSARD